MKAKRIILFFSIVFAGIVLGCAAPRYDPVGISYLNIDNSNPELMVVSIGFFNKTDEETPADGHAVFTITDKAKRELYREEFNFKAEDFYEGKHFYNFSIKKDKIAKGISDWGYAKIIVKTSAGRTLEETTEYVKIPKLTEEELWEINEKMFNQNAKVINNIKQTDVIEITLINVGEFDAYFMNEQKDFFRADIKIKNLYTKKLMFLVEAVLIGSDGKEYREEYYSGADTKEELSPQNWTNMMLVFKAPPENVKSGKIIIDVKYLDVYSTIGNYQTESFEFNISR